MQHFETIAVISEIYFAKSHQLHNATNIQVKPKIKFSVKTNVLDDFWNESAQSCDTPSHLPLVKGNATPGREDQKKEPHPHRMDVTALLSNSSICRLCAEENKHGTNLFPVEEGDQDLSQLVNKYLPIKASHPPCLSTSCRSFIWYSIWFRLCLCRGKFKECGFRRKQKCC